MRHKLVLLSALLILATLLSACVSVSAPTQPVTRTLNVTGSAQVALQPDIAYISIGVHTENPDAKEAVGSNNAEAQKVTNAIKALGVDEKDILTTNFSIYPQPKYGPDGQPTGEIVFMVDNTVYVTLRDLTKIGDVLDAAVTAGANNVYGIQFDVMDKATALSQGRQAAMENAKKQAEELAQAAGVTLGPVQSINFYSNAPVPLAMDNKAVGIGGGASVPISPGQMTFTVDVNVVYEIR